MLPLTSVWKTLLFAFFGDIILNLMPCVLLVLSLIEVEVLARHEILPKSLPRNTRLWTSISAGAFAKAKKRATICIAALLFYYYWACLRSPWSHS